MTLIPTHLSLETILFWSFLPSSEKKKFEQKKLLFWIVAIISIFPDLDVFIGLHRGIFHSIFPPTLLVVLGTLLYYYYNYMKNPINNKKIKSEFDVKSAGIEKSFVSRCLLYSGILWLIHILLDLDYPIAIFYPLSDRLFQIDFIYILDLRPFLILPAMIIGLGFNISGVSYLRGIASYFINLPPSQRQEIFGGTTAKLPIDDFFLHFIIFVIFLIYVGKPMAPSIKMNKLNRLRYIAKFDTPFMVMGLILLIIGSLLGPMIGLYNKDYNSITSTIQVSQNVFSPAIAITFDSTHYLLQPNTPLDLASKLTIDNSFPLFNYSLLIIKQDYYWNFSSKISDLFKKIPLNSTENELEFKINYTNLIDDFYKNSISLNSTNQNVTHLNGHLQSNSYAVVGIIDNWNSTEILNGSSLIEKVKLEAILTSSRITVFLSGILLIGSALPIIWYSYFLKRSAKLSKNS